jgi:SAM-dependent methyltransferase
MPGVNAMAVLAHTMPAAGGGRECPLCGGAPAGVSWLGATTYQGQTFTYLRCGACGSLYCDPMPDELVLSAMYAPEYLAEHLSDGGADPTRDADAVLTRLRAQVPGTFVDYGCGRGHLLEAVRDLGWTVLGVEWSRDVAAAVSARTGVQVLCPADVAMQATPVADVLHLGDVLEHMTHLPAQLRTITRLVRPGGIVIAQGPLEANACVFTWAVRGARTLRGFPTATVAPYHVLLATATGQRRLFERCGLDCLEFSVREVDWPAPAHLGLRDLADPRRVALFTLRRLSRATAWMAASRLGNRYVYVGRVPAR